MKKHNAVLLIAVAILSSSCTTTDRRLVQSPSSMQPAGAMAAVTHKLEPLVIQEQGSFAVGGKVINSPGTFNPGKPFDPSGQTLHGDHAYVFYQKPVSARKYPLTFLHGAGQSSKTWETTPDGREGFQTIFLRRNFSVYLLDQPRRGRAGRSTLAMTVPPETDEQMWFQQFRLGIWPEFYPGVQFPRDKESLNQYFRQMTPNTGPFDMDVISDAIAALYAKDRPGHSGHSFAGRRPWLACGHEERQYQGSRELRIGQRLSIPRGGASCSIAQQVQQPSVSRRRDDGRVQETDSNPNHPLLRGLHSGVAS